MNQYIVIKTQFEAIHKWEDCPIKEVAFLKYPHRHIFYVIMKWQIFHNNRDKEFIYIKHKVEKYIRQNFEKKDLGNLSCEQISNKLAKKFPDVFFISIFEDNENGTETFYG